MSNIAALFSFFVVLSNELASIEIDYLSGFLGGFVEILSKLNTIS